MNKEEIKKYFIEKEKIVNSHNLDRYIKICLFYTGSKVTVEKTEKHHILPRSLFPELVKNKSNLVKVPVRLHYILHKILTRALPESTKMATAFVMISHMKKDFSILSSKDYEKCRKLHAEYLRKRNAKDYENGIHISQRMEVRQKIIETAKRKISNGTFNLTSETSKKLTRERIANKTHNFMNILPWNHTTSTEMSRKTWYYADEIMKIRLKNPSFCEKKILTIFKNTKNIIISETPTKTVFNYFSKSNLPEFDKDWLEFKQKYERENY